MSYTRSINKDLPEYYTAVRGKIGFYETDIKPTKTTHFGGTTTQKSLENSGHYSGYSSGSWLLSDAKTAAEQSRTHYNRPYQKNPGHNTRRVWNR